jgi:hypothetical protein
VAPPAPGGFDVLPPVLGGGFDVLPPVLGGGFDVLPPVLGGGFDVLPSRGVVASPLSLQERHTMSAATVAREIDGVRSPLMASL